MADEYMLDVPAVRRFVGAVRAALEVIPPAEALETLRPAFAALLADQTWLPTEFQQGVEGSGMGGGIGTWLIYRSASGDLSLFSLVVPPGAATPVHDHLAWGMVGLYAGEQDEEVYAHRHGDPEGGHADLVLTASNRIEPGDFYVLLPPKDDIHRVRTTSAVPSVSIHLLGNDTGCVWRHAYTPEDGTVRAFRSGWSNAPCEGDQRGVSGEGVALP